MRLFGAPLAFLTLLTAMAIGAAKTSPTTAITDGSGLDTSIVQSQEEAFDSDLGAIAVARGWTIAQAREFMAGEQAVGEIAQLVAARSSASFVGSYLSADPNGAPTLLIKGAAEPWLLQQIEDRGVAIEVADGQPYSFDELDERRATVHKALQDLGYDQVVTRINIAGSGEILATVTDESGRTTAQDLVEMLPLDVRSMVDVSVSAEPVVEPEGAFGGMRTYDAATPWCTSGFTVIREISGELGVSTAGHCEETDGISHPGHGLHSATWKTAHLGQWGDVGWFATSQSEADDFYADASTIRDVSSIESVAGFSVGEPVCGYGRSTNARDCSLEIRDVLIGCGDLDRLVQMNGDTLSGGDSGGPWYFGNRAFGGHQGNCDGRDSFTKATHFDEALGIDVLT